MSELLSKCSNNMFIGELRPTLKQKPQVVHYSLQATDQFLQLHAVFPEKQADLCPQQARAFRKRYMTLSEVD